MFGSRVEFTRNAGRLALAAVVASVTVLTGCPKDPPITKKDGGNVTDTKPAAQWAKGTGYRKVWAGTGASAAVAARGIDASAGTGSLDLLRDGQAALPLSDKAAVASVQVAGAEPGGVLFVKNPDPNGVGTLMVAGLDGTDTKTVPSGSGVPSGGAFFGATGRQILFVAAFSAESGRGQLTWSDGATAKMIGASAPATTFAFNTTRSRAVAATAVDADGSGKLFSVNMETGDTLELASGKVLASYGPAFAFSADGSTVVYTDASGALKKVAITGGAPATVANAGTLPGVSEDGTAIAFYDAGKAMLLADAQTKELGAVTGPPGVGAVIAKGYVAYATSLQRKGGGVIATVFVAPVAGTGTPIKVGDNVAWDSVQFSATSGKLSAVASLRDLGGTGTYDGKGLLLYGLPSAALAEVSSGVRAGGVRRFEKSDRVVGIGAILPGSGGGKVVVSADTGAPVTIRDKVMPGTLRATGATSGIDWAIFLADQTATLIDDIYPVGTLYGTAPDGPAKLLKAGVIDAQLAVAGGRTLAVVAEGEEAGVWSLPGQ